MRKLNTMSFVFFVLFSMVSVAYSECEGDLNCNGGVDGSDLAMFAADYGTSGCDTCGDVISRIEELEDMVAQLEALLQNVTRNGNDIIFEAVNVQIVNGTDSTAGTSNGLGNLIVGYNENTVSASRTGSHNLVVGIDHEYTSYAGLLAGRRNRVSGTSSCVMGYDNEVTANYSNVTGGYNNTVNSIYSSVSGGYANTVSAAYSSVSGGRDNIVSGNYASISGGRLNEASGLYSSVSGGGGSTLTSGNLAFSDYSSILGGNENRTGDSDLDDHAIGKTASICGGTGNRASGEHSSVSGGELNKAIGHKSSISGGFLNTADTYHASVSGGYSNTASGEGSSVSGGMGNEASGWYSSISGGRHNKASGEYSFVGGGGDSDSDNGNEAYSHYSAILGGSNNVAGDNSILGYHALGEHATVSGGTVNWARGDYSSISGGYLGSVSGDYDWRAGSLFEEE